MPGEGSRALGRLGRVLGWLDAAPAPIDEATLARAARLAAGLWARAFADETGTPCAPACPATAAAAVFAACPDPEVDVAGYRAWHVAQGGLFLYYGPVASRLLGPASLPDERAAALLIADALRLLGDHAAGLGRAHEHYRAITVPSVPFARLVQRTGTLRSGGSVDVNLGAVALGLAIESGLRHVLGLQAGMRVSMWRLFRALADHAEEVRLAVDLPVLVAVYNWAGRHRSAGRRDYGWLNYYAADLLHPLFVSPGPGGFGFEAEPGTLACLRAAASGEIEEGRTATFPEVTAGKRAQPSALAPSSYVEAA